MNTPHWMLTHPGQARTWVRRSRGRRASDRRPTLESVLGAAVVLAWVWGVYEVTLLFLK
ncbi:MAG TPA: hypothetical protein VGG29_01645 [Caulobacteraceae bacterium]|jgi:hypothetical protein